MPRRMVALRSQSYRTRRLQAGDQFEAQQEREAKILVALRKARYAEDGERADVPKPPRRVLKAAEAVTPPAEPAPAPAPPAESVVIEARPAPAPAPAAPAPMPAPAEVAAPNPVPATAPAATRAAKGRGAQPE